MTLKERLLQLVRVAPHGTLIPVEGLAALLDGDDEEDGDLSMNDVGRLAAERFGRDSAYTAAAIRKWIRSGLRGIRLRAYPVGRGYRVRPRNFEQFVADVRGQGLDRPGPAFPVRDEDALDLEEEIRSGRRAYAAASR